MSNELLYRVREVFEACLGENSPETRAGFVRRECRGDAALESAVAKLLEAHEANASFLEAPLDGLLAGGDEGGLAATMDMPNPNEQAGSLIGPYKLREQIGEGGFGVVFVAEQTVPVKRKVALKLIKLGMDTQEVIARFEAERQALAMMDHPHIAKVFDAGTTETGRPYFVMELIRGMPITKFCRETKLDLREELKLFVNVCRAVQHAHQKGIIHRDLKPSNVLITLHDGEPVVKVIDFGIAKALYQKLTEHTVYTRHAQMIGTPAYMSPEQAEMSGLDIDTRSDVYSLGVLLYELLTGAPPFDQEALLSKGFDEMRRIIREDDPPRPSYRISTLDVATKSTLEKVRGLDTRQWGLALKRELDWIVMKALEKRRDRRYESASALAADVERYLNDEPVKACPPTVGYRLRKAIKRQKGLLAAFVIVLLTATIGMVVSLAYANQATLAAGQAKANQTEAEQHALAAKQNALEAKQAKTWSQTLLYAADMKLVSDAIENDDGPRAAELLRRHLPSAGEQDQRGFEWHYYQKRVHKPHSVVLDQGAWVDDVEASPDGKWLATTAASGTVRIYETATWTVHRSFVTQTDSVHGLAWSPDNQRLATACGNGSVQIWDLASGSEVLKILAHPEGANDVVFSQDGGKLYSCGDDNLAKQWDVKTGQELLVFTGHEREVERIALSPDGGKLATASSDGALAIWNAHTAKRQHRIEQRHGLRPVCVAFSPDGRFLTFGRIGGDLYLTDVSSGKTELLTRELDGVEALTFLSGGNWLATANRGGTIHIYKNPAEGNFQARPNLVSALRWMAHEGRALSLTTIAGGESLVSGGRDGQVRVWTPDMQGTRWYLPVESDCFNIETGPGNRLYLAGHKIDIWDLDQRRLLDSFAAADSPWKNLACSRNGRFLAAVRAGQLALFDLTSQQVIKEWPHHQHVKRSSIAISTDGRFIALADSDDWEFVSVYDRDSSLPPRRFPAEQCHCVAFSPDGRWLAAGHMDDLRLFDLKTGGPPRTLKGHSNTLSDVTFSPDGQWLATVSHDRLLKIWEMTTGEERFSIVAHPDQVKSVIFSPDGQTIATCGKDDVAKLWHVATGQPLGSPMPEDTSFQKVRFAGDGRRLIGFLDGSFRVIYDAASIPRLATKPAAPREVLEISNAPPKTEK